MEEFGDMPVNCYTCAFHSSYCKKGYSPDECGPENGFEHWVDYSIEIEGGNE